MAYRIDDDIVNNIRQASDIVSIIGDYISLTQKGKNYFAVCPFHNDHSPSMSVSPEKQIYRCFTCGASGNVITFVMDYEKVSYIEALAILGKKCGIEVNVNKDKKPSLYEDYYNLYNLSMNYYKNNLNSIDGKNALDYLKGRKITNDIIKEFDIGLSLKNGLTEILKKKYETKTLVDLGVSIETNGRISDIFKNRIMFPIKDIDGNTVAFSGRIYNNSNEAKYVNSKETVIFKKGNTLYNYHNAKEYIRKQKEIIICEGFMEIIRLSTIGVKNAVALMGTSFTKEQLNIISNLKVNVVLNLDNDSAGKLATYNIGCTLENEGIHPTVIVFSNHKDTDELISIEGEDAYRKAYIHRLSFIDYKLNYLKENKDLSDSVELSKYVNEVINNINKIDDEILKDIKVKELCKNYNISEEVIKSKIIKSEPVKIDIEPVKLEKKYDKYSKSEIRIIYLMLNYEEVIQSYIRDLGYLINDAMKNVASEIVNYTAKYSSFSFVDFMSYIIDKPDIKNTINEVMCSNQNEDYTEEEIETCFTLIKKRTVDIQIEKLKLKQKNTMDIEEQKKIGNKIQKMKEEVLKW